LGRALDCPSQGLELGIRKVTKDLEMLRNSIPSDFAPRKVKAGMWPSVGRCRRCGAQEQRREPSKDVKHLETPSASCASILLCYCTHEGHPHPLTHPAGWHSAHLRKLAVPRAHSLEFWNPVCIARKSWFAPCDLLILTSSAGCAKLLISLHNKPSFFETGSATWPILKVPFEPLEKHPPGLAPAPSSDIPLDQRPVG
jgi:hypothetical protein